MPGWNELPDYVRCKILRMVFMRPLLGGEVPSPALMSKTSRLSKGLRAETRDLFARDYGETIIAMRDSEFNVLGRVLDGLQGSGQPLSPVGFSACLHRLAFTKDLDAAVKKDMLELSDEIGKGEMPVVLCKPLIFGYIKLCMPLIVLQSSGEPAFDDSQGLREMIAAMKHRYPKSEYLCVALGASADPVAVGLRMLGYTVEYLALSGIEDTTTFRMMAMPYVQQRVAKWPVFPKVLLIDAMATGAALEVMKSLVTLAYKGLNKQAPPIVLLSLNQPDKDHDTALELVKKGDVATMPETSKGVSKVQMHLYKQEYKDEYLGRLFPKNKTGNADPAINQQALSRLVVAMMSGLMDAGASSGKTSGGHLK